MMGIANSYTMEASFGGSVIGTRAESHFSTQDYEQTGKAFCQTLLDFYDEGPSKERLRVKILTRLLKEGSSADEPTNIKLSDYSSDEGDTTSTSSSNGVCEEVFLTVPPPSPATLKKTPLPRAPKKKPPVANRSPNVTRKTLPLCKATVEFSVCRDATGAYATDASELSDSESEVERDVKVVKVKKKKKRRVKKKAKVWVEMLKVLEFAV